MLGEQKQPLVSFPKFYFSFLHHLIMKLLIFVPYSVVNNARQTAADIAASCGHARCSAYLRDAQHLQCGGIAEESSAMDTDQSTIAMTSTLLFRRSFRHWLAF